MKFSMTLILLTGLLAGCATVQSGNYCDISKPVYFNTQDTIDWLAENDKQFLRDTITNNEIYARLCNG